MAQTYIVVGSGAGGATVAARLRRLDGQARIILIDKSKDINHDNALFSYYVGDSIKERERLFVTAKERFTDWMNIEVLAETELLAINKAEKKVELRNSSTQQISQEQYDTLILAVGTKGFLPDIDGAKNEHVFVAGTLADFDAIKLFLKEKNPQNIAIVGSGFLAFELASQFAAQNRHIHVVMNEKEEPLNENGKFINPLDQEMYAIVKTNAQIKNTDFYPCETISGISNTALTLESGKELQADMVIFALGTTPDTDCVKNALELDDKQFIIVDEKFKTADNSIYALGSAVAVTNKKNVVTKTWTANVAVQQGRFVADIIAHKNNVSWKGSHNTLISRFFGYEAASTGLSEREAKKQGLNIQSVVSYGFDKSPQFSDALPIVIKTVFDSQTGTLFGAQVVGYKGVDKRIDVLSEIVRRKESVTSLVDFESAYDPLVTSALDPLVSAGTAAENVLNGLVSPISCYDIEQEVKNGAYLLDVRTADEHALGHIPNSLNISTDEIRTRFAELPKDKPIIAYCVLGVRAYIAIRALKEAGFEHVYNLSGGFRTWKMAMTLQEQQPNCNTPSSTTSVLQEQKETITMSNQENSPVIEVDACGLQCPGPIMRLKKEIDQAPEGAHIVIKASDPGFVRDAEAWATMTGNKLISLTQDGPLSTARIQKGGGTVSSNKGGALDGATFVVFSDDLDKALASFVLANGAAAAGKNPTMFFTFWGLSVIKRHEKIAVKKDFMGKMFSMMLPSNVDKLSLSKMNFAGAGAKMMRSRMEAKQVDQLDIMMKQAREAGVRFVACQMSMDIMGVKAEELIDGVEIGGVATYMAAAADSNINLFI